MTQGIGNLGPLLFQVVFQRVIVNPAISPGSDTTTRRIHLVILEIKAQSVSIGFFNQEMVFVFVAKRLI
ncbi:MAG: hypothetical protein AAF694_03755 [Bacteroidota bacterium]